MREPLPWSRESFRIKLRTIFELLVFPRLMRMAELFDLRALTERVFTLPAPDRKLFLRQFDRAVGEAENSHFADVTLRVSRLPEPDRTAILGRLAARAPDHEHETQNDKASLDEIWQIVQRLPRNLREEWFECVLELAGQRQRSPRRFLRQILRLPHRYRLGLIQASFAILDNVLTDDTQEPAE